MESGTAFLRSCFIAANLLRQAVLVAAMTCPFMHRPKRRCPAVAGHRSPNANMSAQPNRLSLCQSPTRQHPDQMGAVFGAAVDVGVHAVGGNRHALNGLRREPLLQRLLEAR